MKRIENYVEIGKVLSSFEKGAFAKDVLAKFNESAEKARTFNSVNATLAAMAGKGLVTKEKRFDEVNAKVLTFYAITDAGKDYIAEPVEDAE